LAHHPDPNLRVYAVWLPVLWSDFRWTWRPILVDSRVTNFWDGQGEVGHWFLDHLTHREGAKIEWDADFLFPPGARWNGVPAPLLHYGRPVRDDEDELRLALLPLLLPPSKPPR